jgi:hypothetical protein
MISSRDRDMFLKRSALVEIAANGHSGLRRQYSTALIVLMCMAGLVLVIAYSNVASLLIARAIARQKEMAVRLAIGAGRKTLIRQLLVESALLSLVGAALGLALSVAAARGLLSMLPANATTLMLHAEPDARIFLFKYWRGPRNRTAIRHGARAAGHKARSTGEFERHGGNGHRKQRFGAIPEDVGAAQVALSFLLLMGAGLFAKTLANLKNTHTGFESAGNLVSFQVDPVRNGYTVARTRNFYTDALREIRALPGVKSSAYAMWPLLNGREWDLTVVVEGHQAEQGEDMQAFYIYCRRDTGRRWEYACCEAEISKSGIESIAETIHNRGMWRS